MNDIVTHAIKGFGGVPQRRVPEFDRPVPEASFAEHGEALDRGFQWLDLIARTNGITSLLTFCDQRPVPGGLRKWMKKLEKKSAEEVGKLLVKAMNKEHGPWTDWFPIAQGMVAVEGLLTNLERDGWRGATRAMLKEFPMMKIGNFEPAPVPAVIADLRALAECLRAAEKVGAKFRLDSTPFSGKG